MRYWTLGALALLLLACTTLSEFRADNRRRMTRLKIGMDRSDVNQVMGAFKKRTQNGGVVTNPHRTETARLEAGGTATMMFYYTDVKNQDGAITDDELTPVVLRSDTVVGWGWSMIKKQEGEYIVRIR